MTFFDRLLILISYNLIKFLIFRARALVFIHSMEFDLCFNSIKVYDTFILLLNRDGFHGRTLDNGLDIFVERKSSFSIFDNCLVFRVAINIHN